MHEVHGTPAHHAAGGRGPVNDVKRAVKEVPLWGWGAIGLGGLLLYMRRKSSAAAAASSGFGPALPATAAAAPLSVSDPTGGMSGYMDAMNSQWTASQEAESQMISQLQGQNSSILDALNGLQGSILAGQGSTGVPAVGGPPGGPEPVPAPAPNPVSVGWTATPINPIFADTHTPTGPTDPYHPGNTVPVSSTPAYTPPVGGATFLGFNLPGMDGGWNGVSPLVNDTTGQSTVEVGGTPILPPDLPSWFVPFGTPAQDPAPVTQLSPTGTAVAQSVSQPASQLPTAPAPVAANPNGAKQIPGLAGMF